MKFESNYDITKKVTAGSILAAEATTAKDMVVTGDMNVNANADFNDKLPKNTFSGDNDHALANQTYIDRVDRKTLRVSTAVSDLVGQDKDTMLVGELTAKPGEVSYITDDMPNNTLHAVATDNITILATNSAPRSYETPPELWRSYDAVTWEQLPPMPWDGYYDGSPSLIAAGGVGNFIVTPSMMSTSGAYVPRYTTDAGKTWNVSTNDVYFGAIRGATGSADTFIVHGDDKYSYSIDGGKTFKTRGPLASREKIASVAANGLNVWFVLQSGNIYVSTDGGATTRWFATFGKSVAHGNINPVNFTIFSGEHAIISNRNRVVNVTGYGAYTHYDFPSSSTTVMLQMREPGTDVIHFGHTLSGYSGPMVYQSFNTNDLFNWSSVEADYYNYVPRWRCAFTFDNVAYSITELTETHAHDKTTVQRYSATDKMWLVGKPPTPAGFNTLFTKRLAKWLRYDMAIAEEGDLRYLQLQGGEVGSIKMEDAITLNDTYTVKDMATPANKTDAVSKEYVDSLTQSTAGTTFTYTVTNTEMKVDTVSKDVETIRYAISAKRGDTARYYSQINVIANGVDDPASAEYSVIQTDGLDLECSVRKAANGDTELHVKSNMTTTELSISRLELDF